MREPLMVAVVDGQILPDIGVRADIGTRENAHSGSVRGTAGPALRGERGRRRSRLVPRRIVWERGHEG